MLRTARTILSAAAAVTLVGCDDPTRVRDSLTPVGNEPRPSLIVGDVGFMELPGQDPECMWPPEAAFSVNDDRLVVGLVQYSSTSRQPDGSLDCGASQVHRAAVWDADGNLVRILDVENGVEQHPAGSFAYDVNNLGQVVGVRDPDNPGEVGFLWTTSGAVTTLGPLAGDRASTAYAINESGEIAGSSFGDQSGRAVIWLAAGGHRVLDELPADAPPLPAGGPRCYRARGINDGGDVVGSVDDCSRAPEAGYAVVWPRGGGIKMIGAQGTAAIDINVRGEVLVAEYVGGVFVWTAGRDGASDVVRRLPAPSWAESCGWTFGMPTWPGGIDDHGNVAGVCTSATVAMRGVIWTPEGVVEELPDPVDGPANGSWLGRPNNRGDIPGMRTLNAGVWHVPFDLPNRAPTASAGGPYAGAEGAPIAFDGRASSDPDRDALTYEWNFTGATDASGALLVEATGATPSYAYGDEGTHTVTLTVIDTRGGRSAPTTASVAVHNAPPTATFDRPTSVNEGSPIVLSLTGARDPSPADAAAGFEYAFDCADGSGYSVFGPATSRSCPTVDNEAAPRAVGAQIKDRDGGVTTYVGSVPVLNAAPTASILPPVPTQVPIGKRFTLTGSFADVGVNDAPWRVEIDWDLDDPASPVDVGTVSAQGTSSVSHVYSVAKTYQIRFWVIDKDGATGPSNIVTIVACDPKIVGAKSCR